MLNEVSQAEKYKYCMISLMGRTGDGDGETEQMLFKVMNLQ